MFYQFDDFELDADRFELYRSGTVQHVEPLVFDLLFFLVQNPNRIISRDEVINEIWGGRIMSDATISSCIKSARKAIGDSGENQKYIKTIRGRGIQFLGVLATTPQSENIPKTKTDEEEKAHIYKKYTFRYIAIVVLFLIASILYLNQHTAIEEENEIPSVGSPPYRIAVMPFSDMSANNDQEYFGNGMAEEILNLLTTVNDLKVTSRTTAFSLNKQNLSIPEIAEKLDVNYILEGSIRNSGNQIRVTAQLIDVGNDKHLWSQTFDRELIDVFAVQDDIGNAIADALQLELMGNKITHEPPTKNMEAYTLYLQGHQWFLDRNRENIERAMAFYNRAIEIDPNFAEAWADLAASYSIINSYGQIMDENEAAMKAMEAADTALTLKPNLAQAWAIKGYINIKELKRKEARLALERATELNPNNETAWMWLGSSYTSTGFFKRAQVAYENAIEITPGSAINHGNLGRNFLMQRQFEKAKELTEMSLVMGWWPASIERAALALIDEDSKRAIDEYTNVLNKFGQPPTENLEIYVNAYFDPSLRDKALTLLNKDNEEGHLQAVFGSLLLLDGEQFIRFVENINLDAITATAHLFRPPFLSLLNQSPVKLYLDQIGLINYWREEGWPDICAPVNDINYICKTSTSD